MPDVDAFIERWTAREGGAERANYQMFLSELCDLVGVARPDPAGAERGSNDYVFERAVTPRESEGSTAPKRIDLYKKGCFILEAKQSRLPGAKNAIPGQLSMLEAEPETLGRRSVARGWDVMMQNARRQAETYVFLLDADHPAPPFLIICDVGNALELFADFTGTGRAYSQFPDRKGFRIYLEDLRKPEVRALLAAIWTDPKSLDPARESARVTREIARRLAEVSKALEAKHPAEDVAHFLMRCIFTMFAEDVDLIPKGEFTQLLADCVDGPDAFVPLIEEMWAKMDAPQRKDRFFSAFRTHLRHFNGNLFKDARAFPLGREEIGELLAAARAKWTEVDPAIFGTLLEQALDKAERKRLGAHYTPRAYVQRLVEATVMEPLRDDWRKALTRAEAAKEAGDEEKAAQMVRAFHHQLCATRVLDPACGTGNFLYVSLELMKKLEGEVLETLARLGATESLGLERETVDPHQFLGLELNPRAAAIAELVVWIGYLQQHYRTRDGHPAEPILKAFNNINFGRHQGFDAVLTWDGYPLPALREGGGDAPGIAVGEPHARKKPLMVSPSNHEGRDAKAESTGTSTPALRQAQDEGGGGVPQDEGGGDLPQDEGGGGLPQDEGGGDLSQNEGGGDASGTAAGELHARKKPLMVSLSNHEGRDAKAESTGASTPALRQAQDEGGDGQAQDGGGGGETAGAARVETYPNPRRPVWPEAEFIVGNPPFIGGKDIRSRLGSLYAEALWAAHKQMNESADFVMYWWDRAAELLTRKKTPLRRFGFVTTNSISQVFQRRTVERHLNAKTPVSLVFAIPDHPWTKATKDSAAVRIAMTVGEAGKREGVLLETVVERELDTDEPVVLLKGSEGRIHPDLSVGVDITKIDSLLANEGLCSRGIIFLGDGFILNKSIADAFVSEAGTSIVRPYMNGRDLVSHDRGFRAIDLDGYDQETVRRKYPKTYQHLLETVKPIRDRNTERYRRENWWLFGRKNTDMRDSIENIDRYIATVQTSKHRIFMFVDASVLADQTLIVIGSDASWIFAALSSSLHTLWSLRSGGWMGVGNDPRYTTSRCFDPFPFPDPSEALKDKLRAVGEELDATRKKVLADHPDLTLTGLYNVLEKLKAGAALSEKDEDVKQRGLVLILKELHETIDKLTVEAYGWPADLSDEAILERLVALNAERAAEEKRGIVRWLRPDYQIPRFAKETVEKTDELALPTQVVAIDKDKPAFPSERTEQPLAIDAILIAAGQPMAAPEIARAFKRGGKRIEPRVVQALTVLARYGHVTALPDGRYAARRAA
ncbi:class I SAM-dependent DNA methyltransferase [Consotaella aegiceratis]|uniref:class I SAM-dependent DNA methyltransferase n=1 Tax=Consotaella aegiceratis TaxID=3097961 RepID=UPI002F41684D